MDRPRVYHAEAVVLKHMPIGEADRILTIYTPYIGKLRAVAKGVRRPKSKMAGHLEPLTHSRLMLARGRNLDVVSQAETIDSFIGLKENLDLLSRGIYIADLIDSFAPEETGDVSLFKLLLETLAWLEKGEGELLLRFFELKLLEDLGYLPELYQCVACRKSLQPVTNLFSPDNGGVMCPDCQSRGNIGARPIPVNALKLLRYLHKQSYAEVRKLKLSPTLLEEVKGLLYLYIRHLLERDVRSTRFLESVAQASAHVIP